MSKAQEQNNIKIVNHRNPMWMQYLYLYIYNMQLIIKFKAKALFICRALSRYTRICASTLQH